MAIFSSAAFSLNMGTLILPYAGESPRMLALRIANGASFASSAWLANPTFDWVGDIGKPAVLSPILAFELDLACPSFVA